MTVAFVGIYIVMDLKSISLLDRLLAEECVADQCIEECQAEIQQHQNEIRVLQQKIRLHNETKRKIRNQLHKALNVISKNVS